MASVVLETPFSFSKTGNYFCYCGNDGKIKIWDTSTGVLKQEYTKNLHLSSPCSCLAWIETNKGNSYKKRRLSSKAQSSHETGDVIAIGTTSGTVMLYSVSSNSILSEFASHTSKVNCLSVSKSSLFTCSDDGQIVELDLSRLDVQSKWKTGKDGVKCILALSCGKKLLSASCTIKLWDLNTHEVLKTFVGHASKVFMLLEVSDKGSYFVSAAKGDRVISAWSIQGGDDTETSLASFLLPNSVASVHLCGKDSNSTLCAVSESGVMHVFQHKLNGCVGKPLKPKMNITIASENAGMKGGGEPLPIHSSLIMDSGSVLMAYGNPALLMFEILSLVDNCEEHMVLLRRGRRSSTPGEFNNRAKMPNIDGNVEYLGVGDTNTRLKGQQRDVPLEQRLDNLALASSSAIGAPKKDNMAQLLLQGLQSKNRDLIEDVLFRHDESVIVTTVRNLPMQSLYLLLKELTSLLQGKTFTSRAAVRWLSAVLRSHAAILLANPELTVLMEPLLSTIETKVSNLSELLRLRGRLTMVTENIERGDDGVEENIPEALVSYQDRVDDESDSDSSSSIDSADEWNELSEMDDSEPE